MKLFLPLFALLSSQLHAQLLREPQTAEQFRKKYSYHFENFIPFDQKPDAMRDSARRYRIHTITEVSNYLDDKSTVKITRKTTFDRDGHVLQEELFGYTGSKHKVTCAYAADGKLTLKTTAVNDTVTQIDSFSYDARRKLSRWNIHYVKQRTDIETVMEYDNDGRMTSKILRDKARTFTDETLLRYENGRPASMLRRAMRSGKLTWDTLHYLYFRYDAAGRVTELYDDNRANYIPSIRWKPARIQVEYDGAGYITRFTENGPVRTTEIHYTYDERRRLSGESVSMITDLPTWVKQPVQKKHVWSADGLRDTILTQLDTSPNVYPNLEQLVVTYDAQGRIVREEKSSGQRYYTSAVSEMRRTYNSKGQMTRMQSWEKHPLDEKITRFEMKQKFSRKGLRRKEWSKRNSDPAETSENRYTFYK